MDYKKHIASIKDFPSDGIIFRDITPLMQDKEAYKCAIDDLTKWVKGLDKKVDLIASPEARGFLFGCPMSYTLDAGFIPVRKPGKLPRVTISESYELEYGVNEIQIHEDSIKPGQNVVIVDDLLATGGTVEAAVKLIKKLGGNVVGICFVMELLDLKGRDKLKDYPIYSIINY